MRRTRPPSPTLGMPSRASLPSCVSPRRPPGSQPRPLSHQGNRLQNTREAPRGRAEADRPLAVISTDVSFHAAPPFVSLWVLAVMSPKRRTFELSPLLPQRGREKTRATQHKEKGGGDASRAARESQKPLASRYQTPAPQPCAFRRNPLLEGAYTEMHTLPEPSARTVKAPRPRRTFLAHSGPHGETLGWQYEVLPLFLLCFLFLKYSRDQGSFQGIMLCQKRIFQKRIFS